MMNRTAKTLAMLSLSACILAGGAISSFAAAPVAAETAVPTVSSSTHTTSSKVKVNFKNADGSVSSYTVNAENGQVNGKSTLEEVPYTFSNFSETTVYEGTLPNGEKVMTVTASTSFSATIDIEKEAVEGYDLYAVNADGTETKLEVGIGAKRATFKVDLTQGAALIHMVAQAQ